MKTNILKLTTFFLLLTVFFTSCEDKDKPFLTVDETPITVIVEGGEYSITVKSNRDWFAVIENAENVDWCTLNNNTGNGDGTITVNISENTATTPRSATVKIASGSLMKSVVIIQETLCYCIMDTLKGEWIWNNEQGYYWGNDEFKSIIKIFNQNEDGSANYEVFVEDTLFYRGSFQAQDIPWDGRDRYLITNIQLPHAPTTWAIHIPAVLENNAILFWDWNTTSHMRYYYERKRNE
ncbi:MAG: BACON domain-containing protein [Bacteroidales bacterium]|jgi:hypothetical protein|nr:BACON domain-containing protein [Bacteroidales bacterium]